MEICAIVNRDSGTLRAGDPAAFCRHVERVFAEAGHRVDCRQVHGRDLIDALRTANDDPRFDCLLVAGGDGSISCAGGMAWRSGKVLGVIPAGTMNLFSRSLGVPLEIWQAATALAGGTPGRCDIATANDRPFLHQFSVGFHPRMVRLRNRYPHHSRIGKIWASIMAALDTIRRPPVFPVIIECDGSRHERLISGLSVSNNPFGEGHIPYADRLDTGRLGIYLSRPLSARAAARVVVDMMMGSWRLDPDIEALTATTVHLTFPKPRRSANSIIDGELVPLQRDVSFAIHPGALNVLWPTQ